MERKKFMCKLCNWKFARNFTPLLCPYCGKATVILAPEDTPVIKVKH